MHCVSAVFRQATGFLFFLLAFSPLVAAQQSQATGNQQSQTPAPPDAASAAPRGARNFVHEAFQNRRHNYGFSLGVFGFYDNNVLNSTQFKTGSFGESFAPSVYLNAGRGRSQVHVDYSLNYRLYNDTNLPDGSDHSANLQFQHRITRRITLDINDQITSSTNQATLFLNPIDTSAVLNPGFSTDVFLQSRRTTTNATTAALSLEFTRKSGMAIFGAYDLYRFAGFPLADSNDVRAGFEYDHRVNRSLDLFSGYSTYFNKVNPGTNNVQIHRFQVLGANVNLNRNWFLTIGGGVERGTFQGISRWGGVADAIISWRTPNSIVELGYHRGASSTTGLSNLVQSNQVDIQGGTRFNKWINGMITGSFTQSVDKVQLGTLRNYLLRAELDFALRSNVVASMNVGYQTQNIPIDTSVAASLNRCIAYVGVQYLLPAFRR